MGDEGGMEVGVVYGKGDGAGSLDEYGRNWLVL